MKRLTFEQMESIYRELDLSPVQGTYWEFQEGNGLTGCCPFGALVLYEYPVDRDDPPELTFASELITNLGYSSSYAAGFMQGFDGNPGFVGVGMISAEWEDGYEDGTAVREKMIQEGVLSDAGVAGEV